MVDDSSQADATFSEFADKDDKDLIGPEGELLEERRRGEEYRRREEGRRRKREKN